MKIQQSSLHLASHAHTQQSTVRLQPRASAANESPPNQPSALADKVSLSSASDVSGAEDMEDSLRTSLQSHPLWALVQRLIVMLTGEEPELEQAKGKPKEKPAVEPSTATLPPASAGRRFDISLTISNEALTFEAQGVVTTDDGRQIVVNTSMQQSRQTVQASMTEIPDPRRKDPLVINFSAASASLSDSTIQFDVDADGKAETIAFLAPGSGFIALDRNGDKRINDGSELFGSKSGDGFADLATFDQDQNGWIDENDAVWQKLLVWAKDANGKDQIASLQQLGIGALALDKARGDYSLRGSRGELGMLRSTGIYLRENGASGTLQQVDLNIIAS